MKLSIAEKSHKLLMSISIMAVDVSIFVKTASIKLYSIECVS